ncbi:MAG: hypothetical protein ACYC3I_21660 [Gemmataceae bacterium]
MRNYEQGIRERYWRGLFQLADALGVGVEAFRDCIDDGPAAKPTPQTARHAGKGERWIPLFPELRPHVAEAFDSAPEGEVYLVRHSCLRQRRANVHLRKGLTLLLRKAGVMPWPRLFHNLRASRQTELAATFPSHVVCAWIGNSERIAAAHYLQAANADFEKAITERGKESAAKSGAVDREALHFPVQSASDSDGQELTQPLGSQPFCPPLSPQVLNCQVFKLAKVGLEPTRP